MERPQKGDAAVVCDLLVNVGRPIADIAMIAAEDAPLRDPGLVAEHRQRDDEKVRVEAADGCFGALGLGDDEPRLLHVVARQRIDPGVLALPTLDLASELPHPLLDLLDLLVVGGLLRAELL